MLKVLFVLGCLLCLTLAHSDESGSSREERSPGRHSHGGHGPPHGKPSHPCITEDVLRQLFDILRNSSTTTTTTAAPTTTTAAITTPAPNTTV
ncbi:probable transcription-associated protein 1 [Poeciliopsis prolifica]|uniref:probable transcription-associated protein 1 n=1 Tax=Poeciliopsis prolifica TaxID=188132 RepID=UPI0024138010|nr:probable transcription-associated protein 1 [Poeciliopsis prolifica]